MSLSGWFSGKKDEEKNDDQVEAKSEAKAVKAEKVEVKKPDFRKLKGAPWDLKDVHIHALGDYYLKLYPTEKYLHDKQKVATECQNYNAKGGAPVDSWVFLVKQYGKVFGTRTFAPEFVDLFKLAFDKVNDDTFKGSKELVLAQLELAVERHFRNVYKGFYDQNRKKPNLSFVTDASNAAVLAAAKVPAPAAAVTPEAAKVEHSPKPNRR